MNFAPLLDPRARMRAHRRHRVVVDINPKTRKHMKLYNVIHVWDVYVVAESEEDAMNALHAAIHDTENPEPFDERVAIEIHEQKALRQGWLEKKPLVGAAVGDADFEKLKGKTTAQIFDMFHDVRPANEEKAPEKSEKKGKAK